MRAVSKMPHQEGWWEQAGGSRQTVQAALSALPTDSATPPPPLPWRQANSKSLAELESDGMAKLMYRKDTGEILGVHMIGARSRSCRVPGLCAVVADCMLHRASGACWQRCGVYGLPCLCTPSAPRLPTAACPPPSPFLPQACTLPTTSTSSPTP